MPPIKIKISTLLPLSFLVAGTAIVSYEIYQSLLLETGWVRGEFYATSFLNFCFIFALAAILYSSLRSKSLARRYLMSIGIGGSLLSYWHISLSNGSDFPVLAALLLVAILFIMPGLFILRLLVFLIEKVQAKRLENSHSKQISILEIFIWLLALCVVTTVLFFTIFNFS